MDKKIYLDNNSTLPASKQHLKDVMELLWEVDGNPSNTHFAGRKARVELERSRKAIASLISVNPNEILFNSGATEGNNHVLTSFAVNSSDRPRVVIMSEGEHSSVFNTAKALEKEGAIELHVVSLTSGGQVDLEHLKAILSSVDTSRLDDVMVCLIYVNNETGIINPIADAVQTIRAHAPNAYVHLDAVQALGKIEIDGVLSAVSSATFSAHKIGGLKGIGCLYVKKGTSLAPLITGGGQEKSRRSGTENLPGILSFGLRAQALLNHPEWMKRPSGLFPEFIEKLSALPGVVIHGDMKSSTQTAVNFHVAGQKIEKLNLRLDMAGIAVSNGSACSSGLPKPSRVLLAMGYSEDEAKNSLRVSFGPETTEECLNYFLEKLSEVIS